MLGEGDGNLAAGPLEGITVPLPMLKDDYYRAMGWNPQTGHLARARAEQLGMTRAARGLRRRMSLLAPPARASSRREAPAAASACTC